MGRYDWCHNTRWTAAEREQCYRECTRTQEEDAEMERLAS